jgi:hypothetical protein
MRAVMALLGGIAVLAGIGMMYLAYDATTILSRVSDALAVQVTQVYSEASFYGIMAIACFALATVMAVSIVGSYLAQQHAKTA